MSKFLTADLFARLFRTALQVAGGVLSTKGYIDESSWTTISGALLTAGTTLFTVLAAKKA